MLQVNKEASRAKLKLYQGKLTPEHFAVLSDEIDNPPPAPVRQPTQRTPRYGFDAAAHQQPRVAEPAKPAQPAYKPRNEIEERIFTSAGTYLEAVSKFIETTNACNEQLTGTQQLTPELRQQFDDVTRKLSEARANMSKATATEHARHLGVETALKRAPVTQTVAAPNAPAANEERFKEAALA